MVDQQLSVLLLGCVFAVHTTWAQWPLGPDFYNSMDDLRTNLNTMEADLNTMNTNLETNMNTMNTNLENNLNTMNTNLETNMNTMNTNLETNLNTMNTNLETNLNTMNSNLNTNIINMGSSLQIIGNTIRINGQAMVENDKARAAEGVAFAGGLAFNSVNGGLGYAYNSSDGTYTQYAMDGGSPPHGYMYHTGPFGTSIRTW